MSEETKIRNKIRNWCRYWHFNVCAALGGEEGGNDGHRNYLTVVDMLDDFFGTDASEAHNPTGSLDVPWRIVRKNILNCNMEQLKDIYKHCTSKKDVLNHIY